MAWTAPRTWTDGELVTAAIMNPHIRDNLLVAGPHLIARKTSDQSVTSSTVLVNDSVLKFTMGTNEVWEFVLHLIYVGNPTGDIKVAFTVPASGTVTAGATCMDDSNLVQMAAWTVSGTAVPLSGSTTVRTLSIPGVATTAGTGGDLQMQFAQNTSDVTATTVKTNSTIWAMKLA